MLASGVSEGCADAERLAESVGRGDSEGVSCADAVLLVEGEAETLGVDVPFPEVVSLAVGFAEPVDDLLAVIVREELVDPDDVLLVVDVLEVVVVAELVFDVE